MICILVNLVDHFELGPFCSYQCNISRVYVTNSRLTSYLFNTTGQHNPQWDNKRISFKRVKRNKIQTRITIFFAEPTKQDFGVKQKRC